MIFINTLRMIADLSVYFFFAELFVISAGYPSQLIHMLLLSLCYGILTFLKKKKNSKLYILLPLLVLIIPGRNILALLPPIAYILYLIAKEHFGLSWDRQSELFSLSLKIFLIAGACICLSGNYSNFVQYSLPIAFLSVVTSVLLMRMLRQDSSIYLNPQYQQKNCMIFLAVLLLAWMFSRDFIFELIGKPISIFYMKGIYPILSLLITCFAAFLRFVMKLFSWIKLGEIKFQENQLPEGQMGPTYADFSEAFGKHVGSAESVLTTLAIVTLLVIAFFFFRWLILHKGEESFISQGLEIIRGSESSAIKKERATTTVLQIRKQYRIFLRHYRQHGGKLETSTTSKDVLIHSSKVLSTESLDTLNEMRDIYLQARYRGTATKADLKRMKEINKEMAAK